MTGLEAGPVARPQWHDDEPIFRCLDEASRDDRAHDAVDAAHETEGGKCEQWCAVPPLLDVVDAPVGGVGLHHEYASHGEPSKVSLMQMKVNL